MAELGTKVFFENTGSDFSAFHAAEQWCRDNGYSYGSMARDARIGIKKGDCVIVKWHNLDQDDINHLDGYINGDYRNGKV